MHRQHPYAGYGPPPGRRGDSPTGPGPDRGRMPDRGFRGRGRGVGGPPPGSYGYEPPYHGTGGDSQYGDDPYDYRGSQRDDYYPPEHDLEQRRRPQRLEEKAHDPLIEERLQRERPCRTLFIRNIKYETDSAEFRRKFEEFGEIKTFFDLISHRGMVFCTYYDMRAAERAKDRLQGTELAGRPIDVHYSLPREDQRKSVKTFSITSKISLRNSEPNQGIIIVTLIDSPSKSIDDVELRRKLQTFGDVKSIQPNNGRPDSRMIEFYDTRSADEAHGKLRHQPLQDGIMETEFAFLGDYMPPGPAMQEECITEGEDVAEEDEEVAETMTIVEAVIGTTITMDEIEVACLHLGMSIDGVVERSPPPRARSNGDSGPEREKLDQARKVQELLAALKQTGGGGPPASGPPPSQPPMPYSPPPNATGPPPPNPALPPSMAQLAALLTQAAQLPQAQQAQAAAAAIQQFQAAAATPYPPPPQGGYSTAGPPPNLYGSPLPGPSAPYSYPPPPNANQPPYVGGGGPPNLPLPPDTARYNYPVPPGGPPPPGGQSNQSLQDIMALLVSNW
ncbi:hypothetical protein PIIN_01652 [Serendipita indica DSM 11827]|uniref:RRM domain-containing protein n=1 Tax=Serendipita indica (strain DSM 11827) TaxID=1109443 RepID=G4T939_SERID|nr:hypothetical protein PIIN_01652 [Serendipita indica DSM 11827]